MSVQIPTSVSGSAVRDARGEAAREASMWLAAEGGHGDMKVYAGELFPPGYAVGVRKPGKYANPNQTTPIPYDMLPLIWTASDAPKAFDAGFNDICRSLWNLGQVSQQQRSEAAARTLGGLLFRDACFADHVRNADGLLRYAPPAAAIGELAVLPSTRIETLTATLDMPAQVFLVLLEVVALIEDTKYWFLNKEKIRGRTGRTNTLFTCARALACGLGEENPMDFAYALMRGRGVASLTREKAREYFA